MTEVRWYRLDEQQLRAVIERAGEDQVWAMDTETDGLKVRGPGSPHSAWWIGLLPVGTASCFIVSIEEYDEWGLEDLFKRMKFTGHNFRFDCHALTLVPERPWCDTQQAAYYRNTAARKSMDHIAQVYGWPNIKTPPELKREGGIALVKDEDLFDYLANDCLVSALMYEKFGWEQPDFDRRLEQAVLRMEQRGLRLLPDKLGEVERLVQGQLAEIEAELSDAGLDPGILASPAQVGQWLVDHGRRLTKTKTGKPSTSAVNLARLVDRGDAVVAAILQHRKTLKLLTSFTRPLAEWARGGILYPETRTGATVTGRFSCAGPNLQQIPKRGPVGKAIRGCMTSPDGSGITACDFSQVELRVAAAFAGEAVLLEAFEAGRCPHTEVAARMLDKRPEDVEPHERFGAKAVNFGILNGMGAPRLSVELKSTKREAQRFLDDYLERLHSLAEWMEGVWREAEAYRIVRNVAGRTRIFSNHDDTRPAISMRVQGSAAELMRKAVVAAEDAGLEPLLSIHDEILIPGQDEAQGAALQEVMEDAANNAFPKEFGSVSFKAEFDCGPTWGDV